MLSHLPEGLYDLLLTEAQVQALDGAQNLYPLLTDLSEGDSHQRLSEIFGHQLSEILSELSPVSEREHLSVKQLELINSVLVDLRARLASIAPNTTVQPEPLASPP